MIRCGSSRRRSTGYSTFGWVLVSAAVEAAADEPFFTFMRTQIFKPLGMTETTFDSATEPIPDRATFYHRVHGDNSGREPASPVDYSCFAGAGAFLSTPSDLVRFGMAIERAAAAAADTVRMLQAPQVLASGKETEYGLGWMVETVPLAGEPTRLVSHASRTLVGGSTSFLIFPARGIVVAVTTNTCARTRGLLRWASRRLLRSRGRPDQRVWTFTNRADRARARLSVTELEWAQQVARTLNWDGEFKLMPDDRLPAPLRAPGNTAQHWIGDTTRIREELGCRETLTREEAIRRTIEWERDNPPTGFTPYQIDYRSEDEALRNAS